MNEAGSFTPYTPLHGFKKRLYTGPLAYWRRASLGPFAFIFALFVFLCLLSPVLLITALLLWLTDYDLISIPLLILDLFRYGFFVYLGAIFIFGFLNTLSFFFKKLAFGSDLILTYLFSCITLAFYAANRLFVPNVLILEDGVFAFGWESQWDFIHGTRPNIGGLWFKIEGPGAFLIHPQAFIMFVGTQKEYEELDPASL